MKLILAIVDNAKIDNVSQALINSNFRVTQLATTSGFLRGGVTTLMVGVQANFVNDALQIIRDQVSQTENNECPTLLYVLNVRSFHRI